MNFDMKTPCNNCPFRHDVPGFLRQARAEEIAESLLNDQTFPCHKTTKDAEDEDGESYRYADGTSQHCAGAMIMLMNMGMPNQMMRIAMRLGGFNPDELDMCAPVFGEDWQFIEHHDS
jgi:hypothetical protein